MNCSAPPQQIQFDQAIFLSDRRKMTVELLQEPPQKPAPEGCERRRSRRHDATVPATLTRCDSPEEKLDIEVRDISLHGAGFHASLPLAPGDRFLIDIGGGPLRLHARLRVVNCRLDRRNGHYKIGAEFC